MERVKISFRALSLLSDLLSIRHNCPSRKSTRVKTVSLVALAPSLKLSLVFDL